MSTLLEAPAIPTIADLIEDLGGIPANRILLRPAPGTATVQDAVRLLHSRIDSACELIDGTLVKKPSGLNESRLAMRVVQYLGTYLGRNNLGFLTGERGAVQLWESRIRIPDVSFFAFRCLADGKLPEAPIPLLVPDLVVEVLSESNTPKEMELKRQDYFRSGVRIVWEIDCEKRTVEVFTGPDESKTLKADDALDGGDVLPGYQLPLHELFSKLDRAG